MEHSKRLLLQEIVWGCDRWQAEGARVFVKFCRGIGSRFQEKAKGAFL
jgi:hypothetical protein